MAKVTAPLFSFGASGQLAKAIVYFPWKGIDAVRQYVIPANPNTALQDAQRLNLKEAVVAWHTIGITATDQGAWNRFAATLASAMSGFNAFVKRHIFIDRVPLPVNMGFAGNLLTDGAGKFKATVTEAGAAISADLIWGYSPTFQGNTVALVETVNVWAKDQIAAVSGAKVYAWMKLKNVTPAEIGRTGLYTVTIL